MHDVGLLELSQKAEKRIAGSQRADKSCGDGF